MKKHAWKETKKALRQQALPMAAMRPADLFWEEFQARARLRQQERPVEVRPPAPTIWPRWVLAASGVAAGVLVLVAWPWHQAPTFLSPIISYQVLAPHSAVIIMTDSERAGTILWVAAPESAASDNEEVL